MSNLKAAGASLNLLRRKVLRPLMPRDKRKIRLYPMVLNRLHSLIATDKLVLCIWITGWHRDLEDLPNPRALLPLVRMQAKQGYFISRPIQKANPLPRVPSLKLKLSLKFDISANEKAPASRVHQSQSQSPYPAMRRSIWNRRLTPEMPLPLLPVAQTTKNSGKGDWNCIQKNISRKQTEEQFELCAVRFNESNTTREWLAWKSLVHNRLIWMMLELGRKTYQFLRNWLFRV